MNFREKVKVILEGKTVTMAHPESQKKGTQGSGGGIKVPHSEVEAYKAKGWVLVRKSKVTIPKSTKDDPITVDGKTHGSADTQQNNPRYRKDENSDHPFYQKVKALSSGKKSQSLLEKKSKTIKLLIGKIKPCGEKSKMEEAAGKDKKQQSELVKKGRKKRTSWEDVYEKWVKDKQENPGDYRTSRKQDAPKKPKDDEDEYDYTFFPKKK